MRGRASRLLPTGASSRRALVAGGIGNVVEWYDFAIYGAFVSVIAITYFPGADPAASLSASFAVFATAFLARPVGAVLFGRLGRRQVLAIVIILMAVPAFLLIRRAGPAALPLGYVLVALPLSCLVIVPTFLAELFPTPVRSTALAITYGLGTAIFGGTAAAIGALLAGETAFQVLDTDASSSHWSPTKEPA